ncbi:hypothetical protein I7X30_09470 [Capnocytophaga sp. 051621]|uniref:Lipoprotein n=1 Tax=Capnocytophaga periodontitidis TaxID=2795027 RepID=A0ABS0SND8_9FLAO|nr:hypothetical protein [Capnocytophaga periodontitidis]MBI1647285.1 hypothetical protein [Capnocytophaga periodontitidis]
MKKVLIIFATALVVFACNGQTPKNKHTDTTTTPKIITEKEAIEAFKKQKHRFEIKGYKIYYNDQLMKLDSVTHFIKRIGEPSFNKRGQIVWETIPIWGFRYSTMERFFIYFRPFAEGREELSDLNPFYYAVKRMPVIDGYMLVEGHPIHKDTTPKELSEILVPIYGDNFGNLMGTPTIVFELKEEQIKEIIPHWGADKAYNNIFIGFDYLKDEKTKKIIGLKSVDYYNFMM